MNLVAGKDLLSLQLAHRILKSLPILTVCDSIVVTYCYEYQGD